ncbi:hypothetical protein SAMN02746095_02145 [Acidocella aminolytica 101 = DSM 11237]|uniref:Transposase n=1 Tax=Acidocella aminolytica 101 = DSM 11237 TaxID=1120923 RepID=A0A0D6PDN1_9PROT|nr:hypothetical protein Aam_012_018 [Acidocella aminolytica 101 = DSM 11237]GBQ34657.1 hypothetical protein AA11237_0792 [Acidocella aminolytica 101 = DSM 11237]SHF10811.1 hypothetical protein SAMN02746095_02145 [Acidocella aminolytica 101 = DSM 11237]
MPKITERGYPAAEVSQRLGVSQHSRCAWKRQLAKVVRGDTGEDAEIRQLQRELPQVTEKHDIGKGHRVFGSGGKVRNAFIAAHHDQFQVRSMCRGLHIQPNGFCFAEEPGEPAPRKTLNTRS